MSDGTFDERVRIASLDIDSTLTGDREAANAVREILREQGYLTVFNTSRTEEMLMTEASFVASRATGRFHRPAPHLGRENGRRIYVPPELCEPVGLLDPDVIVASTGTSVLAHQEDGSYLPDQSYEGRFDVPSKVWRHRAVELIAAINGAEPIATLAPIEYAANYEAGLTDVYPPDYRIQLNFGDEAEASTFKERLSDFRAGPVQNPLVAAARRIRYTDDSAPGAGRYKAFITPRRASKVHATRHIVRSIARRLVRGEAGVELLVAGDSFPDLAMGLYGGLGARVTLLLAGGSRLAKVLTETTVSRFSSERLSAVKKRLVPMGKPGHYRFRVPGRGAGPVEVIVGDLALPGSSASTTVHRYLAAR